MAEEVDHNDGTSNQDDDAIYLATISCWNLLNHLTKQADSSATLSPRKTSERSVKDAAFLEDMARSFNIWINYTGALTDLSRCLDFRLKGYDDIRDMVLAMLHMLERNLEYGMFKRKAILTYLGLYVVLLTVASGNKRLESRIRGRSHRTCSTSRRRAALHGKCYSQILGAKSEFHALLGV